MSSPHRLVLLGSLLVAAAMPAQQPLREAVIGEVRDRDGKPWEGATVHLLHRAHPGLADPFEPPSFSVPERQVTAFVLKDPDGMPIANATLFVDRAPFAEPLATTGPGGELELLRAGAGRAMERSSMLDEAHAEFPVDQDIATAEKDPKPLDRG